MITHFQRPMQPLADSRTIRVYTPPSYEREQARHYPVLYMHDGQNCFYDHDASFGTSWRVQEVLESLGLEWIVVGIDNCTEGFGRFDEYAPWENHELAHILNIEQRAYGGKGAQYVDWIANELKPWVDAQFRTEPDKTMMMGSSMGGLISTFAACRYPHLFKRIASVSSAYWFNQAEIETCVRESDLSAIEKLYLDIGSQEVTGSVDANRYVVSSERVVEILKQKATPYRFEIVEGALHNEAAWNERLPMILCELADGL